MRVIIVGTGSIGRRHVDNILRIEPQAKFVILRQNKRHDSLSDKLSAQIVASVEEAMNFNPDCAVIATPSSMHADFILDFIKYGVAMYIEKPVVIDRVDIEKIRSSISQYCYESTTLVGCNLRFLNSLRFAHNLIRDGVLGQVARAVFQAGQWLPDWRPGERYQESYSADPNRGGGVVWDLIHEIDSVRYLLGDFDTVESMMSTFEPLGIKSDAVANLLLGRKNGGPLVSIGLDYVARMPVRRYEIYGEKGSLVWDLPQRQLQVQTANNVEIITDKPEDFDVLYTYEIAMKEFLSAVKSSVSTSQDLQEGLKSAELAIMAKEQK